MKQQELIKRYENLLRFANSSQFKKCGEGIRLQNYNERNKILKKLRGDEK